MLFRSGREVRVGEFCSSINLFLDSYEEEYDKKIALKKRENYYRFKAKRILPLCKAIENSKIPVEVKQAFSDTLFLLEEKHDGQIYERPIIIETVNDRIRETVCDVYDLLDLCVAKGWLGANFGYYETTEAGLANDSIIVFRPKKTEEEEFADEGWTKPGEISKKIIF